jgi:hypothetical protein
MAKKAKAKETKDREILFMGVLLVRVGVPGQTRGYAEEQARQRKRDVNDFLRGILRPRATRTAGDRIDAGSWRSQRKVVFLER